MSTRRPFDAVLMISFGGPQGLADIRPFLANVLRGRRVPPERIEEVVGHYEHFGGVSPLTAITMRQAQGLRERLAAAGIDVPVFVGMRNWHPLLPDTLRQMAEAGVTRAIGFISAAQRSYSSCTQYKRNVFDARADTVQGGLPDVDVTYVDDWHEHPGFIDANAAHVQEAIGGLPPALQDRARLVFTAHSIPASMTGAARYQLQLQQSAERVAERLGRADWALVYQSRSGRPEDPWLGPDVSEYLRRERAAGLEAVVLCPIGFVCDHIEVLYDLDEEAAQVCREVNLPMTRARAANDHPAFLDMIGDVVLRTWRRYERGVPLPIAPPAPERVEGPPPARRSEG
ncbi:MAG TPA: ferrochelatase [Vicinamibacterales bacterium]|nr:ferrochelatase [Vicinamibacterales bacterium]